VCYHKSKVVRFQPFAAASEAGLVSYVEADWNESYFFELEAFDGTRKVSDDQVDATSDSFITLAIRKEIPSFAVPINLKTNEFRL